jgi:coronatine-insensitive protein 1
MGSEVLEPQRLNRALSSGYGSVPEEALHLMFSYLDDPHDQEAASLMCRLWHCIDTANCTIKQRIF